MQNELSSLIKLQEFDAAVDELNEKAEALVPLIQSKNQRMETLKSELKAAKDSLSSFQLKKKQLELDADAQEKLLQKHQTELNSLKSNDAYKAMMGEIQTAKEAVTKIEDQILDIMEQIDRGDKDYKLKESKFKTDEASLKNEVKELESRKANFLDQAKVKQGEREAYAATIDAKILPRYENIREKRGGLAIVPMINNSCGGCRMTLTPNIANEVKKGKHLVLCESCSRILYLPVDTQTSAPVVEPGAVPSTTRADVADSPPSPSAQPSSLSVPSSIPEKSI